MKKRVLKISLILLLLQMVVLPGLLREPVTAAEAEINTEEAGSQDTDGRENAEVQKSYQAGDLLSFGSYPAQNGSPIEWVILEMDAQENKMLLLSKDALDCLPYQQTDAGPAETVSEENQTDQAGPAEAVSKEGQTDQAGPAEAVSKEGQTAGAVTWETSSLRKWLNEDFLQAAFSDEEKEQILSVVLQEEETQDQVFLLSLSEAENYFSGQLQEVGACQASETAIGHGVWTAPETGTCWWWLRSPGHDSKCVAGVGHTGVIGTYGTMADSDICGVRPAMWVMMAGSQDTADPEDTEYTDLMEGDNGEEVRRIQAALAALGYLPDTEDSVDGDFGPKTREAVRAFQEAEGLEVTGICDAETQRKLLDTGA